MKTTEEVVDERMDQYGHPAVNFEKIAFFWSVYLEHTISTQDVGYMMILLKIARTQGDGDPADSLLDIKGYANCIELIRQSIAEREMAGLDEHTQYDMRYQRTWRP